MGGQGCLGAQVLGMGVIEADRAAMAELLLAMVWGLLLLLPHLCKSESRENGTWSRAELEPSTASASGPVSVSQDPQLPKRAREGNTQKVRDCGTSNPK